MTIPKPQTMEELHKEICWQIGNAHARAVTDVEFIRHRLKDLALADLESRARWARYTLEVLPWDRQRLTIQRQMEADQTAKPIVSIIDAPAVSA